MKTKQLENLGLTKKEALAYIACLELGNGSALKISEKARLPKSTTYDLLISLNKKGLVNIYPKKSRSYFSASDPNILLNKAEAQKKELEELIPELHALYHSAKGKPKIRFYEGKAGMEVLMKEVLEEADEMLAIASLHDTITQFKEYFPRFPKERVKKKIPLRIIYSPSPEAETYKTMDQKELRTSKIIDVPIPFKSALYLWRNKVAILTLRNDISITIIEDPETYKIQKVMFESMWKYHPETKSN